MNRLIRFVLLFLPLALSANDWSMYMGNHHLTGNNDGVIPPEFRLVWRKRFPWRVFHAVASDGLVFVSGYTREIRCLDFGSGRLLWRAAVPFPVIRMPVVWGGCLFVSAGKSMLCYNKWDGRLVWSRSSGGFSQLASPIVVGGILFYGNRGAFFARDAATGRQIWRSGGVMSYGASPLYADGRLFLQHRDYDSMRYYILCLDAKTGRRIWAREIPRDANVFTPSVYRGSVYMVSADRVMAFAVKDGARGASRRLPARAASSPVFTAGRLHVSDSSGKLHILQPDDLQPVLSFSHHRKRGNRFAVVGPRLYLCNDRGTLLELQRKSGEVSRRFSTGVPGTHSRPLVFRGRVLLPAGNSLFCVGRPGGGRGRMPDRGILRLLFVHSETKKPLRGDVRIVWRKGLRWWSGVFRMERGVVRLEERRLFPSRMTFEKRGFLFRTRRIAVVDRGKLLKIFLKPIRHGSRLVFRNILFNTDSSGLLPASLPVLQRLVRFLRANPGMRVRIEGHTDSTGNKRRNLVLSRARAAVVRDYLIRQNIAAARLRIKGLGQSRPVADNRTAAGRKLNRRTEIRILSVPVQTPDSGRGMDNGRKKGSSGQKHGEEGGAGAE